MKAVGFWQYGEADVLKIIEVPTPEVGSDTVLIQVAAAGVNPADWHIRKGQFKSFMKTRFPFIGGSDVAGVVTKVGSSVKHFRPGDAVYAMLPSMTGGGYAEYAAVAEDAVAHMPSTLTFIQAAAVPLTGLTALQALGEKAEIKPGMRVLIYGASGGVGTFAVQIAKAMGAHVTAISSGRNLNLVRELGADVVSDYSRDERGGEQYDVVFDAVNYLPLRKGFAMLRGGDILVSVNPIYNFIPIFGWLARMGNRRLRSVVVKPQGSGLATLKTWIEAGQVRPVIERCYPMTDIAEAQRYSETGHVAGKLVVVINEQMASSSPKNEWRMA